MAACPIAAPVVDADTRLFHGFDQAPRLPGPPRLRTERRPVRHETPAMPALMDHLDLRTQRDDDVTGPQPRPNAQFLVRDGPFGACSQHKEPGRQEEDEPDGQHPLGPAKRQSEYENDQAGPGSAAASPCQDTSPGTCPRSERLIRGPC